jgi:Mg2+ and Co2+ transporter CorA
LRYSEPKSFNIFRNKLEKQKLNFENAEDVLLGILETITGRVADILENLGQNTEILSKKLFKNYAKLLNASTNVKNLTKKLSKT